jgi:hypothetical protein
MDGFRRNHLRHNRDGCDGRRRHRRRHDRRHHDLRNDARLRPGDAEHRRGRARHRHPAPLSQENIYTIKLVGRGHFVPKALHANMFLVRRAREVMEKDVTVPPPMPI